MTVQQGNSNTASYKGTKNAKQKDWDGPTFVGLASENWGKVQLGRVNELSTETIRKFVPSTRSVSVPRFTVSSARPVSIIPFAITARTGAVSALAQAILSVAIQREKMRLHLRTPVQTMTATVSIFHTTMVRSHRRQTGAVWPIRTIPLSGISGLGTKSCRLSDFPLPMKTPTARAGRAAMGRLRARRPILTDIPVH